MKQSYAQPVYPALPDSWRYEPQAVSSGNMSSGYPTGQQYGPSSGLWQGPIGYPGYFAGWYRVDPILSWQPQPGWYGVWPSWVRQAQQPLYTNALRDEGGESDRLIELRDYGPEPFVTDIEDAAKQNRAFRTALWTGTHLQLTLMSIPAGEDIGLERHDHVDQFIRIEEGRGLVQMGNSADRLDFQRAVEEDDVILIPAGTWHNLINTGREPLKLYSIYSPPNHPRGTVHATKRDAMAAER